MTSDQTTCINSAPRLPVQTFRSRKLYLPALIIVTAVLLLLVFIGFSTYWNLDRARKNTLRSVHQQGEAILNVLETGIRSVAALPGGGKTARRLIANAGKNDAVSYVYVADDENRVFYRSGRASAEQPQVWHPRFISPDSVAGRIHQIGGNRIYEIARPLPIIPDAVKGAYLVIGLEMDTFEMARHEDFHHAIIMISILFALAAGAGFFIFVIHRYHRTNRQLKEAQDYTRQVVDSMANGLLSIDAEGRIISWNHLGLELLGIRMPGDREIGLGRIIDFEKSGVAETLATGNPVIDREINLSLTDGPTLPLAVSVTPILTESGRCEGAVIILRDLREIKRLQESVRSAEKLAALGKMAAAVAHEIRNPLSSIRGFAKFLHHTLKDRDQEREYAAIMVKEVDRMNRVVTDLLNFAKPLELEPEPTDPVELVTHTARLVGADAAGRNITIRVSPEAGGEKVMLDPNLMIQVLLNLMLNALQAVDDGGRVDVAVNTFDRHTVFRVEDDGPGIGAENAKRIFDPFFTTHEKGTGLGLAIVDKIIENHQGKIRVESPVPGKNRGCQFIIEIPTEGQAA